MDNGLLLLPRSSENINHMDYNRLDYGTVQGSQGVLQTLLDLGEAFLSSEIGEDDLQDLEAKLSAARSRDYDTIRDLQKKIEELSGMSAMVSRLKDELREEKMKAQEEAEDLTQEMAELRYQLMERVEEERELRAKTEEASLRRITELEKQLKLAWCENSALRGEKQSVEAVLHSYTLEVEHIKSVSEEERRRQAKLLVEKEETESILRSEVHELRLQVDTLEKDLSVANAHLNKARSKVDGIERSHANLKSNDRIVELCSQDNWQSQMLEETANSVTDGNTSDCTSESYKGYLEAQVRDIQGVISDFKNQLQLIAVECTKTDQSPDVPATPIGDTKRSESARSVDQNTCYINEKKLQPSWTVQEIVDIVDTITEEMTKLLRLLLKGSQSRKTDILSSLESRLQLWSNIPQKALPEKLCTSGIIMEWGDLVVDLVAQSRRELHVMQQKVLDLETELDSVDRVRDELNTARDELSQAESYFSAEMEGKDGLVQELESKLEEANKTLTQAQEKLSEQEETTEFLRGMLQRLEVDTEKCKSQWALEKKRLEEIIQDQYDWAHNERSQLNKEVSKLENIVEELQQRLNENERELEELVGANAVHIDSIVAAKLRRLDQKLKHFQSAEAELRAERAELASQVVWLQAKLEEAERELEAGTVEHVEALIQYEEERGLLEAELKAERQGVKIRTVSTLSSTSEMETKEEEDTGPLKAICWEADHKHLESTLELLKKEVIEKDQQLASQKENLSLQREINRSMVNHSAHLESELHAVQQKLLLSESQANEMGSVIANLQEELLLERMETARIQEDLELNNEKIIKQEKEYLELKERYDELLVKVETMQRDLAESSRKESNVSTDFNKLGVELSLAKELVMSEVQFHKVLKQKEEQLNEERSRAEAAMAAQKKAEIRIQRQLEGLKVLEREKMELQKQMIHTRGTRDQLERERDDLKAAFAELESQFSRRRAAFLK